MPETYRPYRHRTDIDVPSSLFLQTTGFSSFADKSFPNLGILLFNASGAVVFADERIRETCGFDSVLTMDRGILQIETSGGRFCGRELHALALASEVRTFRIPRPRLPALDIRLQPVPWGPADQVLVLCLVRSEESEMSTAFRGVAIQFRLTPSEIEVCLLLRDGENLRLAAAKLGISYGAVRARLKRIFEKTGVQRQKDLVRLLLCGPMAEALPPKKDPSASTRWQYATKAR